MFFAVAKFTFEQSGKEGAEDDKELRNLVEKIRARFKVSCAIVSKEELVEQVVNSDCQVIVVLGAGDIDRLVQPLANALSERSKTVEA